MLLASQQAIARNAAEHWDRDTANKRRYKSEKAAEDIEFIKFEDFAEAIAFWGYTWEPVEATTRDGYKLTMFHITGGAPEGFVRPELPESSSTEDDGKL